MTRESNFLPAPSEQDMQDLRTLRHALHRHPELSGEEKETAQAIVDFVSAANPDQIITGLGGHGVAVVFDSGQPGPRVLLRCELDALPIPETTDLEYCSEIEGKGHLCGHDGHMAMLSGVARVLAGAKPARGSVILMYQPAEEDGSGAAKVVADPTFASLQPDYAFAIHNMPGLTFGTAAITDGPTACASRGMRITLEGRTAHASMPETGLSPAFAMARLIPALTGLTRGSHTKDPEFSLVTVTHAKLGEPAFGIAPAVATLFVTLRSLRDDRMMSLVQQAEKLVQDAADQDGLTCTISYEDIFSACESTAKATQVSQTALDRMEAKIDRAFLPMRASEDFGNFGGKAELSLILLGTGEDRPALHNSDYEFPDALIPLGLRFFTEVIAQINGWSPR